MKKLLFITLLILIFSNSSYAKEKEFQPIVVEQEKPTTFFKSSFEPVDAKMEQDFGMDLNYMFADGNNRGRGYGDLREGDLPVFKKYRLYLQKKWRGLSFNAPEPEPVYDEETGEMIKVKPEKSNKTTFLSRFKRKSKAEETNTDIATGLDGAIADSIKTETSNNEPEGDIISFETGISKHITEKELTLDADNVSYDEETGDMIATGRPSLYLPPQRTRVVADKMTYNQDSDILKGIGNVVITKDGISTTADYIEVDMNEETIISDNVTSSTNTFIIDAKKAVQQDDLLILTDGRMHSDKSEIYRMSSRMIGPQFTSMILDEDDKSAFFGDEEVGTHIHLSVDKLYVEARKNHDMFIAKKIGLYRKDKKWFSWPSLTVYTNKERNYLEANYPELGSRRKMGMFLGPGFAFGGPWGSVVKVIPFINYQHDDWGIGAAIKYRNKFNYTEMGYGTAADVFFLRGSQRLDDNLYLQYSANSFMDEWFLGSRMPKYMAELYYDKAHPVADFLGEGRHLNFRHRLGFGLMEDNDRNYYGEKINSTGMATTRLRYMAQVAQNIYHYENPENRFYVDFNIVMQGSAAVYGNGDTQFVARLGPGASMQYKNWKQDIAYLQTGYEDNSPMPRYDAYRYGHSSVRISEILRINKYLSVGWSGTAVLSNDALNNKLFQENRFAIAFGPDDLKLRLGYDFVRRTTFFGFDVAFDTKGTNIDYKRMEIKNPERLGKQDRDDDRVLSFITNKKQENEQQEKKISLFNGITNKKKEPVLQYARVINIEDPDKETVE